jgi:nucleoside-diphosphate-sugar epimerase
MIVGSGLIAKSFSRYIDNEEVIIFASGVSNSAEERESEFVREEILLKKYLSYTKKLIYFSTTSVVDGSIRTPYINHKIKMEKFISDNHLNYLIFRLPIVVGHFANEVTFFNSIKTKIQSGQNIIIKNVSRCLIDIDDLKSILPILIDDINEKNKTLNICFNNFSKVIDIVERMEYYLNSKSSKHFVNCNSNVSVDNTYFLDKFGYLYNSLDYNDVIFIRYLKQNKSKKSL